MKKRLISFILAAMIVLSVFTVSAYAETTDEVITVPETDPDPAPSANEEAPA